MRGFLDVALSSADLERACETAGVGMGDYLRGRRNDLAFDAECRELDLILRLSMQATVTAAAARGDRQAVKMVARGDVELRDELAKASAESLPRPLQRIADAWREGDLPDWAADVLGRLAGVMTAGPAAVDDELSGWEGWSGERWERWAAYVNQSLLSERTGVYPLWLVDAAGLLFGDPTGEGCGVVIVDDDGRPVAYTDRRGTRVTTGRESVDDARPLISFVIPMGPDEG
jgi:hypothetical protein